MNNMYAIAIICAIVGTALCVYALISLYACTSEGVPESMQADDTSLLERCAKEMAFAWWADASHCQLDAFMLKHGIPHSLDATAKFEAIIAARVKEYLVVSQPLAG